MAMGRTVQAIKMPLLIIWMVWICILWPTSFHLSMLPSCSGNIFFFFPQEDHLEPKSTCWEDLYEGYTLQGEVSEYSTDQATFSRNEKYIPFLTQAGLDKSHDQPAGAQSGHTSPCKASPWHHHFWPRKTDCESVDISVRRSPSSKVGQAGKKLYFVNILLFTCLISFFLCPSHPCEFSVSFVSCKFHLFLSIHSTTSLFGEPHE